MILQRVKRRLHRTWSQLRKAAIHARLGRRWAPDDDALQRRLYPDYATYVRHQRLKLDRIRPTAMERHDRRFHAALSERLRRAPLTFEGRAVLCLAARQGTEVRAFVDQGAFAVGVDLNPGKDNRWVVVGDFHALQYADASVDVVYTNALDHVLELERLLAEVRRVLKPAGVFLAELGMGSEEGGGPGFYEALGWKRADELVRRILATGFELLDRDTFEEPWEGVGVLLRKASPVPA